MKEQEKAMLIESHDDQIKKKEASAIQRYMK